MSDVKRGGLFLLLLLVSSKPVLGGTIIVPGTKFSTYVDETVSDSDGQDQYYKQNNTPVLNESITNYNYLGGFGGNASALSTIGTQPSIGVSSQANASSFQTKEATDFSAAAYGAAYASSKTTLDFSLDIFSKYNQPVSLSIQSKAIITVFDGSQGDGDGISTASATFSIADLGLAKSANYGDGFGGKPLDSGFINFGGTFLAYTNHVYTGEISASAQAYEGHGAAGQGYAYVDPTFQVVGVSDPNDYLLVLSAGVGNIPISGVPESSTWAMMLLGFGGLGALAYRRKHAKLVPIVLLREPAKAFISSLDPNTCAGQWRTSSLSRQLGPVAPVDVELWQRCRAVDQKPAGGAV